MKSTFASLLAIIMMLSLTSCMVTKDLPQESKNFPKEFTDTFFDNYYRSEPQLAYKTASPQEVEIKKSIDDNSYYNYYFALIENVDKEMFVAVSEQNPVVTLMGTYNEHVDVYQTSSSPNPMNDWTVKSISIYKWRLDILYYRHEPDNFIGKLINEGTLLKKYQKGSDDAFISMIRDAYDTQVMPSDDIGISPTGQNNRGNGVYYCSLLVEFEESDNIVWVTKFQTDVDGNLYIQCDKYDKDTGTIAEYVGKISPEYYNELSELIGHTGALSTEEITE